MWLKANPNIGKTVTYEVYQKAVEKAENSPSTRNDILAKRFGIPMEGQTYFFTYEETLLHKRRNYWQMPCALGADLSQGDDFCAFTFLFPLGGGRFAGSWIMRYIRAEKVLFVCAMGTVVSTSLVVLNLGILSLIALFLGYAFEAIMFPTIFALSLRGLGNYTKRASSYLMMSPIGGAVGPLMMGYVADQTNMSFSFIVPLLSFIVVLLYAWKVKQRSFC